MNRLILVAFVLLFLSTSGWAVEKPVIESEDDRVNYSVGHQVGRDLARQGVDVNPEVLLQGIIDATSDNEPMIPFKQMVDTLVALKGKIVKTHELQDEGLRIRGRAFLDTNAKKDGVTTLESGLQYKVLQAGKGKKPVPGDLVKVNYVGKNIEGKTFDSTYVDGQRKPVQFKLENVIPGWLEGLQLMPEGSLWELYIPYQLAFPATTPLKGQVVIYEIELLQVGE